MFPIQPRAIDAQDLRAGFAERAALLEYEGGMDRREADAAAIGEYLDAATGVRFDGILGELAEAYRRRSSPALAPVLAACGLLSGRAPAYGFDFVTREGSTYRPAMPDEQGVASTLIVPISSAAEGLVDLVAQSLRAGTMLTRLGVGDVIGLDGVDRARDDDMPLMIFGDAMTWLRGGCLGAVVVDWRDIGWRLEGVKQILCGPTLAPRLHTATRRCWPRPVIATPSVLKEMRRAA